MIIAYNLKSKQLTQVEHSHLLKPLGDWAINPLVENYEQLIHSPSDTWSYDPETSVLRVLTAEELNLDPVRVAFAKKEQIGMLSTKCEQEIIKGFSSMALGSIHWYDASSVDQLNLISSITLTGPTAENPLGTSIFYACRDNTNDDIKEYQSHTYAQLQQIMKDSSVSRLVFLQKFSALRQQIMNMTTVTDVKSIKWETE